MKLATTTLARAAAPMTAGALLVALPAQSALASRPNAARRANTTASAAEAVIALQASNAETARTVRIASRVLAVLRRPKRSTDVIRPRSKDPKKRRALAALPSRLLRQAQDFKIYLVPSGNQLCVWPSTGQLTWQTANGDQASMRLP